MGQIVQLQAARSGVRALPAMPFEQQTQVTRLTPPRRPQIMLAGNTRLIVTD
jgi:hypothetical protein